MIVPALISVRAAVLSSFLVKRTDVGEGRRRRRVVKKLAVVLRARPGEEEFAHGKRRRGRRRRRRIHFLFWRAFISLSLVCVCVHFARVSFVRENEEERRNK
jgi:hypothetical protein